MLKPTHRVAVLLHQGICGLDGKTGLALLRYRQGEIVVVIDQESAGQSLRERTGIDRDVPIAASMQDALPYQPDVLAIGIAPSGGQLPEPWLQEVKQAIEAGLSIVNGLHTPLSSLAPSTLLNSDQWIWDIRQEPTGLAIASAQAATLPCKRILAVGTDMSIGKMSTCLELHQAAQRQGWRSHFIGTGQAGIMISGDGIPLDAVRVDFAAGAVEQIVMRYGQDYDLLFVEGQGSLLHPGSTATLPLIRGSQPTHLILVHRAEQSHIRNMPRVKIPPLPQVVQLYETVAAVASLGSACKVAGIALNTAHLDPQAAAIAVDKIAQATQLPCVDPVRSGVAALLNAIEAPHSRSA